MCMIAARKVSAIVLPFLPLDFVSYFLNLEDFQEHLENSEDTFDRHKTTERKKRQRKLQCKHRLCLLLPEGASLGALVSGR